MERLRRIKTLYDHFMARPRTILSSAQYYVLKTRTYSLHIYSAQWYRACYFIMWSARLRAEDYVSLDHIEVVSDSHIICKLT